MQKLTKAQAQKTARGNYYWAWHMSPLAGNSALPPPVCATGHNMILVDVKFVCFCDHSCVRILTWHTEQSHDLDRVHWLDWWVFENKSRLFTAKASKNSLKSLLTVFDTGIVPIVRCPLYVLGNHDQGLCRRQPSQRAAPSSGKNGILVIIGI